MCALNITDIEHSHSLYDDILLHTVYDEVFKRRKDRRQYVMVWYVYLLSIGKELAGEALRITRQSNSHLLHL